MSGLLSTRKRNAEKTSPQWKSSSLRAGSMYFAEGLCRQLFFACFSQGVGRHDQKDVDGHTHEAGDRRTAANDRVDHVARREHQADDGEDKRGLCFARVLCRPAGKNSFREGKAGKTHL